MKWFARLFAGAAALVTASAAFAQEPMYRERAYPQAAYADRGAPSQGELDSILAPVALYPDSLLSQLLMAATFPRDVAEAARWSRQNPALPGEEAVRAVELEQWHPSVKSLVAFPELLAAMGDQPEWVERLGEAFLANEAAVMQNVQDLRRRADESGNLRSDDHMRVERNGEAYVLEQPSPEIAHVPYYDPRVVYGSWAWPDYQPVYWSPWRSYAYYPGLAFAWGHGIRLHRGFFYGGFDWGRRHVRYSGHRPYYYRGNDYWRGWRDYRRDGRRYAHDRSPGSQRWEHRDRWNGSQRWENRDRSQPRYEQRDRTHQPRYEQRDRTWRGDGVQRAQGFDGVQRAQVVEGRNGFERSAQSQRPMNVPRAARVLPATPGAGVHENPLARPSPARSAQPIERSQPVERTQRVERSAQPAQRSGGIERSGGDGGWGGGHRARER